MHRRSRNLAVLAALLTGTVAQAETTAYCARVTREPLGKDGHEVVKFDADSGRVTDGSLYLSEGDRLQFIFKKQNPFRYDYRFAVTSQPLGNALALRFLAAIPGLELSERFEFPPNRKHTDGTSLRAEALPAPCTESFTKAQAEIEKKVEDLRNQSEKLTADLGYFDAAHGFLLATSGDSLEDPKVICERAERLKDWPHAPGSFKARAAAFTKEVQGFDAFIAALKDKDGKPLAPECQKALTETNAEVKKALTDVASQHEENATKVEAMLQENKTRIEQLDTLLSSVMGREDLFYETRFISARNEPTGVKVELFRRDLRMVDAAERSVAVVNMQLGTSRFSLSAGVVVSSVDSGRIIRQSAKVPEDGSQVRLVFGREEQSTLTVAPAFFFNTRLYDWSPSMVDWGIAVGVVTAPVSSALRIDYTLGTYFSFWDILNLHAGVHLGQRDALAGDFRFGEEVPAGTPDPIPTTKKWQVGFLMGFSLQIN
ncbi:hypothetical protein [Corallococcus exercitus]|uniref:hypothetical protein n=1 Tax=Corallococcus exercitus TaxID=2316736 RepID=UPI0035D3EDAF